METIIAGITFPNPFFNASGVCGTTQEELEILRDTGAGGIWTKTTTMEPREGNLFPRVFCLSPQPVKYTHSKYPKTPIEEVGLTKTYISGNSVGLANGGCTQMNQIVKNLQITDRPIVLSVGGPDLFDIVQMVELSKDNPAIAAIEINPSCPNLAGTDMLAFDFSALRELLKYIKMTGVQKPIGLKLPYYQNPGHFKQIATIIEETKPLIRFITCINGMPGLVFDPETNDTRTRNNDGITGMGGDLLLPFALGNIVRFYKLFKEMNLNVDIIGCGGVTCPEAAWQMIWAGAKGVQVGTRLLAELNLKNESLAVPTRNPKQNLTMFWNNMVLGLYSAMEKHGGYESIQLACGGYHTMDHVISDENISLSPEQKNVSDASVDTISVQISDNYANTLALKDSSGGDPVDDFPPITSSRRGRSRNRRVVQEEYTGFNNVYY
jgi:dihydroorotate dehydrogenase (fumarate)